MSKHGITSADAAAVADVVESLLDPLRHASIDAWRGDVIRRLQPVLGADAVSFQLPYGDLDLLYTETLDRAFMTEYTGYFMPELIRTRGYAKRIEDIGVGNRMALWGEERRWFYRSSYYNELLRPGRAFDPVWAAVPAGEQRLPAILLAHHSTRRGMRFGQRGLDVMTLLRPALQASVTTVRSAYRHRGDLAGSVDGITTAALIVSGAGRVRHQNPAARHILSAEPHGRVLTEAVRAFAIEASRALGRTGARVPFPASRQLRAGDTIFRASVMSTLSAGFGETPMVVVFLEQERAPDAVGAARALGLTPRQAQVAALLAERRTDPEIADALRISIHTARHHVEAALGRLGVRSRRDVAALLRGQGARRPAQRKKT